MQPGPEALCRTEQRAVVLQLERLMGTHGSQPGAVGPDPACTGWHYVIEDGEVHVCAERVRARIAVLIHSGTGPYQPYVEHDGQCVGGRVIGRLPSRVTI